MVVEMIEDSESYVSVPFLIARSGQRLKDPQKHSNLAVKATRREACINIKCQESEESWPTNTSSKIRDSLMIDGCQRRRL